MKNKHCNACKSTKPVAEFAKNKAAASGYQSRCKACMKALYKPKKKQLLKSKDFDGDYAKPTYSRNQLLMQIKAIRNRESNVDTKCPLDYSFLDSVK